MPDEQEGAPAAEESEIGDVNAESSSTSDGADDAAAAESAENDGEKARKKEKGRFQKRIDRLGRKADEATRLYEGERAERERLQLQLEQGQRLPDGEAKPQREQFEDYEAFLEARAQWVARKEWRTQEDQRAKRESEARAKRQAGEAAELWGEQVKAAEKRHADFKDVALSPDLPVSVAMASVLRITENGADILYWLGKNPGEADDLFDLPEGRVAIALGRIEERLATERERERSTAPVPAKVVKGKAIPVTGLSDKADIKDWMRERNKQLREGRARG